MGTLWLHLQLVFPPCSMDDLHPFLKQLIHFFCVGCNCLRSMFQVQVPFYNESQYVIQNNVINESKMEDDTE